MRSKPINGLFVPVPVLRTIKSIGICNTSEDQSDTKQSVYKNLL